uniref:Uncharacterized protein n=1 Tax=Timema monikensis TaxID=170555 RepID=A0A7R9EJI9_9NEOP|nr:unnamed protein product [Timema monikensis]
MTQASHVALRIDISDSDNSKFMSEIDLPIKSEEGFKEEIQDYQQPEYCPRPITFPPIKEELPVKTPRKPNIVKSIRTLWYLSDKMQGSDIQFSSN